MKNTYNDKTTTILYIVGAVTVLAIIGFIIGIFMIGDRIEDNIKDGQLSLAKSQDLVPNYEYSGNVQQTSKTMGKTVEQLQSILNTNIQNNIELEENNELKNDNLKETISQDVDNEEKNTEESKNETAIAENALNTKEEKNEEPITFVKPVEGTITKEFAKDKLIYSETLEEWITHNGVDIESPKTTIVKTVADGVVESIKNDPRYGLTITIAHKDGYKSRYANLLTAEFVKEGEELKKGNTIGTVGNSASFEALDKPHLHFELIKDDVYIDPKECIEL